MTTWYFDAVNGLDANDGLTAATAKQTYNPGISAAGDTFLFKRGVTQVVTTTNQWVQNGISETSRSRYGAYGESQVPYSIWTYAASGNKILSAAKTHWTDFEDMYFDMRNSDCRDALYIAAQGALAAYSINVRRCFFQGSNRADYRSGNGLNIVQEITATAYPNDINIEDCEFFDNEEHGLFILGGRNITVRRCKFYRNGRYAVTGGHGFSSRYNYTTASSGWSQHSGAVWKKTLAAAEPDVYYIRSSHASYPRVRRTASAATTPGPGEYGVDTGILYINIGGDPTSQGVLYAWGRCCNLVIEDCESYDNYWNQAAPYHEGHGFAFDDFADDSVFRRNKAYNNEGCGFSINNGDRNQIISNIAYGNWQAAVVGNPCDGTQVKNNTFLNNNAGTGFHQGEIIFHPNCRDAVISNNIASGTSNYGIYTDPADTGHSGTKNCLHGFGTPDRNSVATATITTDPALDQRYRPWAAECKRTGTYLGGKDHNGKQFYNPPNIGAVDDTTATARPLIAAR